MSGSLRPQGLQHAGLSWSLLKLMSIALVMPSNHLILCHPLLLQRHSTTHSTDDKGLRNSKNQLQRENTSMPSQKENCDSQLYGAKIWSLATRSFTTPALSPGTVSSGLKGRRKPGRGLPGVTGRAVQPLAWGPGIFPKQHLSYRDHHSSHRLVNPEQTLEF